MRILTVERFGAEQLLGTLRQTRLRGYGGAQPYADGSLELVPAVDPEALSPAQKYVLRPGVDKILELRTALLVEGVDVFALDGGVWVTTSEDPNERIPVIPPVIEESHEPDGRTILLVNDGMHRIYAARSCGLPISVVVARGVLAQYPYYAYPLPNGWSDVSSMTELPDTHLRKEYRQPEDYKALFRDFNALYPGVQKKRRSSSTSIR